MSFSEMMESGRGPGVIGMLLALLVLAGFGVLFVFSFDEKLQGGKSIESIIAGQAREIDDARESISRAEKKLAQAPERLVRKSELASLGTRNQAREIETESLKTGIKTLDEELASIMRDFEAYKDKFRDKVRAEAKGEIIERLEARDGSVYQNVTIREVTPVGMNIMFDGGLKRIPYEELPAPMIDRFQFDPKQKAAAIAKEHAQRTKHEQAVARVAVARAEDNAEKKRIEEEARMDAMNRGIAVKQTRARLLEDEIRALEEALPRENLKRLSRAPQMRVQLSNKRRELSALLADVARMQAEVSQ